MKQLNITSLLVVLLSMIGFNASAHDIEVKNGDGVTIYYNYINDTELSVTFRGSSSKTFYDEYTGNVVIPESVTYDNKTYSVSNIGDEAFYRCSDLTSVTIPNSVMSIGSSAFSECSSLTSVTIGKIVISIGDWAFSGCSGLASITIPNSVKKIGDYTFSGCSGLTSVTIGNSVTSIGKYVFSECSELTSIKVASGNNKYDSRDNCNAIIETASNTLVAGCKNTTIPNSVASIGSYAFSSCSGLTSITIPNSVTSISNNAFSSCSGLTSITIPNSVTSIGSSAFLGCYGLTSITIGKNVTSIGQNAFMDSWSITSVTVYATTPPHIANTSFWNSTATLHVPLGTKELYQAADYWKRFSNIVENAESAITITAKDYSIKYGDEKPNFEYSSEGGILSGTPEISCSAISTSPVGTYDIAVSEGSVKNPNVTYVNGTLTIEKAPLTITAVTFTKKQGEAMPKFTVEYAGFKNDETSAVLAKQPTVTCEATEASVPGEYEITVSGAEAGNYDINYVAGKLIVTDADPVTVTAKSYTRKYGEANPKFEYTSEGTELKGTPEITCEATESSPAGTYRIVISKGSVTNYNDTYVNGTLTIEKAPLTITAKSFTKKQGEAMPELTAEYSGFKNNETSEVLTKQPVVACKATEASAPGEYDIIVSDAEAANYEISYVTGKLTVTDADPVTVTAKSYTRKYGEANPKFEFTSEGAELKGTPEITCEATEGSPVGTYPIVISKGSVENYNVTYVNGTLTIEKAEQTVTWEQNLSGMQVGDQVELKATASSGLPVSYTVNSSIAEVYSAGKKTYLDCMAEGEFQIMAVQEGDDNYYSSVRIRKIVKINKPVSVTPIDDGSTIDFPSDDFIDDGNAPKNLSNIVIGDTYFCIDNTSDTENPDGYYDEADNCIVINKTTGETEMEAVVSSKIGSVAMRENYTGMMIEVNGKGTLTVKAQTIGSSKLAVKVGNKDAERFTLTTKNDVNVNYDVTENTYIYIYAVDEDNNQQSLQFANDITATASENSVKVYSITVTPETTGINRINGNTDEVFRSYSLDGKALSQPQKGINIQKMSDGTSRKIVVQ